MKTLYLIDGNNFFYRALHAVAPLTNKEGKQVNGINGFLSMLLSVLRHNYSHFAVCFDNKSERRKKLYPSYKANRDPSTQHPDVWWQLDCCHRICVLMGLPTFKVKGEEADDIIATLTHKFEGKVVIVSGDKDFMQLVTPKVSILNTMTDEIYGKEEVLAKFGVKPALVTAVQALCGDSVDNYFGVEGFGPKTAAKYINEYGSLAKLMSSLDSIENDRHRKALKKARKQVKINQQLAQLSTTVKVKIKDCKRGQIDPEVIKVVHSLGLKVNSERLSKLLQEQHMRKSASLW